VTLSERVLDHIFRRHPEVRAYKNKIVETVKDPDIVVEGVRGEFKGLKFYPDLHIGSKYLVVVYREPHEEKVIITAYFTSSVAKVRGEVIWRKSL